MSRILVFIDESGSPHQKEQLFLGAAVWCLPSSKDGIQNTLRYTIDQVRYLAGDNKKKMPKEIHYSDGLRRRAPEVIDMILRRSCEDDSILKKHRHWDHHPLASTSSCINPRMDWSLTEDDDIPNRMRARIVSSLLNPLFYFNDGYRLDVDIVLDSECWRKSLEHVSESMNGLLIANDVHIKFHLDDSKKVPGLQLADVFAGVTRHHMLRVDVGGAYDAIHKTNLSKIVS